MSVFFDSNIREDRLKTLFKEMVDIYSPSGKEHELVEHLHGTLARLGLPVSLHDIGDGRCNLEVTEPGGSPEIAFVGHLDTVPAFDIEQFEFSEREGRIYGLGTADMKGGCAAMIEA